MRSKNLYTLLCLFVASLFLFVSCQKDELLEPAENFDVQSETTTISNTKSSRCDNQERILTHFITKRTWIIDKVVHENPELGTMLTDLFAGLTMDFDKDSYHIIIPNIGRDEVGPWEFADNFQKILVDKGMITEHYVKLEKLTMHEFNYTVDDPDLGPWTLKLVPIFGRRYKTANN